MMENKDFTIRAARITDAAALLEIYAPYVTETAITFEYDVPSEAEFACRIEETLKTYPYILAEKEGKVFGYAYASSFHSREAYQWSIETSVYVRKDVRRTGLGRVLYDALEKCLLRQGITNMNACIAYPIGEDENLDKSSVEFHKKMGFRMVGRFEKCANKFGKWYDMVWMEKHIAPHVENPPYTVPFDGKVQV